MARKVSDGKKLKSSNKGSSAVKSAAAKKGSAAVKAAKPPVKVAKPAAAKPGVKDGSKPKDPKLKDVAKSKDAAKGKDAVKAKDAKVKDAAKPKDGGKVKEPAAKPAKDGAKPAKEPVKRKRKGSGVVRLKAFWGVFNQMLKRVAVFEYAERKLADKKASDLSTSSKQQHFVQLVKEIIREEE